MNGEFDVRSIDPAWHLKFHPPGIIGELSKFGLAQSPYPLWEAALAGALAYFAGMVGRQYNYGNDGLNLYLLLVALTGSGKDAAKASMNRVNNRLMQEMPAASGIIGPADFASGQAFVKSIARREYPCFVAVFGEIGFKLSRMASPNPPDHVQSFEEQMLKVYTLSGAGRVMEGHEHSDAKLSSQPVQSPAVTILGEGTPSSIYGAIDERQVEKGMLSRFVILEHVGDDPPYNEDHASAKLDPDMIGRLKALYTHVRQLAHDNKVWPVGIAPDAKAAMTAVRTYSDGLKSQNTGNVVRGIWTRVPQKVGRLAALLAVSKDWKEPTIELDHIKWAASLVLADARRMVAKFQAGEMGEQDPADNNRQIEDVRQYVRRRLEKASAEAGTGREPTIDATSVKYSELHRQLVNRAPFKHDKRGKTAALKATLKTLCDMGVVQRMKESEAVQQLNYRGEAYVILDFDWIGGAEKDVELTRKRSHKFWSS